MKLVIGDYSSQPSRATLSQLQDFVKEPWQQEIVDFLQQWFDDSDYVEVKTSGSTGDPKLIQLPKTTMLRSAQLTNRFFGLQPGSVALLCLPASYIAGKMMLVRAIAGNYTLHAVAPSANPFATEELPALDFSAITPYQLLHSAVDLPRRNITNIIVGGSPVTPAMEELTAEWPVALYETFGMTETASHIALRRFNGKEASASFRTLEGVRLSLDDRSCLVIDAPHLHSEQLITNDFVELVDNHSFRWLGRADRVINSGGIKIFPEQVERKLESVIDLPFFISSKPHESLGQQVVLVLECDDLQEELKTELLERIKPELGRYELPGQLLCIPRFVYSTGNKVLRAETLKLHN